MTLAQDGPETADDTAAGERDPETICALNTALLRGVSQKLQLELADATVPRFERLAAELVVRNERHNLTRLTQPDEIAVQHIVDSLVALRVIEEPESGRRPALVDVGSGAGFPGLALAVVRPTWPVTLLDSKLKSVEWLRHAAAVLELEHVTAIQERAEDLGQDKAHREAYDVALARALAPLPTLLELTVPLVRVGGKMVAWKGESADEEIQASANALSVLGAKVVRRHRYQLPGMDHARVLIVVEKRRRTPGSYPRRAGTPKRKPL